MFLQLPIVTVTGISADIKFAKGVKEMDKRINQLERALIDVLDTFSPWYWPWEKEKKYQCRECGGSGVTALTIAHYDGCTIGAAQAVLERGE